MSGIVTKPSRKWSVERKLKWRQRRYDASGPNCPNGHPWATSARYTYKHYRFCSACALEKAEARRNDPATYTGICPNGHPFTRDNTVVTSWNNKICNLCARQPGAKPRRPLDPEQMAKILQRARNGETANAISGEGAPKHYGKGIVSRIRLMAATLANTPDARELKELLQKNGEAQAGRGTLRFHWSPASVALLTAEYSKGVRPSAIAGTINATLGCDFNVRAVATKAKKLGLVRSARVIVPRPKLAAVSTVLRFSTGSLLDRINSAVPRFLARDHRDDVIGDMALAVYEGRLHEADIERRVREFVNAGYRREHDRFGTVSLDEPIFEGANLRRVDLVANDIWQQA